MGIHRRILNVVVASLLGVATIWPGNPALAASARLERLYAQLQEADPSEALRVAREIEREWRQSGSPAMDLLLKRGTDALEAGDTRAAIGHFTALTDHAPDFAEGWYRRALAYLAADLVGPAVADLERALALNPRHYEAIAALGGILAETGKPELAVEAFKRVLAIHPHHGQVSEALEQLEGRAGGKDL